MMWNVYPFGFVIIVFCVWIIVLCVLYKYTILIMIMIMNLSFRLDLRRCEWWLANGVRRWDFPNSRWKVINELWNFVHLTPVFIWLQRCSLRMSVVHLPYTRQSCYWWKSIIHACHLNINWYYDNFFHSEADIIISSS